MTDNAKQGIHEQRTYEDGAGNLPTHPKEGVPHRRNITEEHKPERAEDEGAERQRKAGKGL